MTKLTFLQKSRDDLDDIYMHISEDSVVNAKKMISTILLSIDNLRDFPMIGVSISDKIEIKSEYRMLVVKPYLVFYRVIDDDVYIFRVLHGKRYYDAILEE